METTEVEQVEQQESVSHLNWVLMFGTLLAMFSFGLGAVIGVRTEQKKKAELRKVYNEVALAFVMGRFPQGSLNQAQILNLRKTIEASKPEVVRGEETVDIGIMQDSSGTWKTVR